MKKPTRSYLIKQLDKVFSEYIRKRDSDINGYITCVSCKKKVHWKEANNCHFADRQHMATRWHEQNNHAGCVRCNAFDVGFHIHEYAKFLNQTYGDGTADSLIQMSRFTIKFSNVELAEKIQYYKEQL